MIVFKEHIVVSAQQRGVLVFRVEGKRLIVERTALEGSCLDVVARNGELFALIERKGRVLIQRLGIKSSKAFAVPKGRFVLENVASLDPLKATHLHHMALPIRYRFVH